MNEQKFRIKFRGEIVPNANIEDVKQKLAAFFKVDLRRMESLFSGKTFVLKENISLDFARKYAAEFEKKTGARCTIVQIAGAKEQEQVQSVQTPSSQPVSLKPENQYSAHPSPFAKEVSLPSSFSSSAKSSARPFTYRKPSPPPKRSSVALIIVFIVIIISAFVIFKTTSRKSSPGPSAKSPAVPRSLSASGVLSQNTTTFEDYKGYYTITIPGGFQVTDKSSGNRSKILFDYSPDISITIIASPMNKPWNPGDELMKRITALHDGREGPLSRLDLKRYGLTNFNGLDGYEIILQRGKELAHAYALVSSTGTAFSIAIITKGNNYQENHDILVSAVRKSIQFD